MVDENARDTEEETTGSKTALLVSGLVVALALALLFFVLWTKASKTEPSEITKFLTAESSDVEQRAREVIRLLLNYDSSNFDQRAAEVRSMATGSFRKDYEKLVTQGLGAILKKATASSSGKILKGP